jgi:hypothetical protein
MSRLTEVRCSGKYLKILTGRTDIEDAVKRLEKLTNEEVRMATAQVLKVTHAVDGRVRVVENKVAGVDERVAGVHDDVKAIDDKVAVVVDGAQPSLISQQPNIINSDAPRGKRDEGNHATSRRRHGSSEALVFFFCIDIGMQAKASFQGINYNKTFADGSHRQIPLLIITLPAALIASKRPSGFSKEVFSPNGNPMAHFCGYTENVRSPDLSRADAR